MLPRWLISFRALALVAAFAAAFVPLVTYITDDKRDWLWVHIGVNIAAYIAVALTTIYTTASLMQQDHNKYHVPAYWANNVIMRTWYLGVSKTWRWHVAAAVGRLGLALALAQHLHIIHQTMNDFQGILAPFYYASHGWDHDVFPNAWHWMLSHAPWQAVLPAFLGLLGFALVETAFLSALTLISQKRQSLSSIVGSSVLRRLTIILIFVGIMSVTHALTQSIKSSYIPPTQNSYGDPWTSFEDRRATKQTDYRATFKHWHKIAFSWLDNGTMLAAWMLRPAGIGTGRCIDSKGDFSTGDLECTVHEVTGDLITDASHTLAAYLTYILAIAAMLQLAHYLHWRRERHSPTSSTTS